MRIPADLFDRPIRELVPPRLPRGSPENQNRAQAFAIIKRLWRTARAIERRTDVLRRADD